MDLKMAGVLIELGAWEAVKLGKAIAYSVVRICPPTTSVGNTVHSAPNRHRIQPDLCQDIVWERASWSIRFKIHSRNH